ncbi:PTS system, Lactose/Cellobiose specific IIB subunit [Enterococcus xinjiangensis]|nr:PTS system, Lactose/Cellobiose specific IIB subunit [Enterococcus lactis]
MKPDVIITAENFRSQFEKFSVDPKTAMIYLKNIVSKNEIEEKITPVLQDKGVI